MKDEPIPVNNNSPFPESSFTPHPWAQSEHTLIPVGDSNCPESANLEPNDRATFKEDK